MATLERENFGEFIRLDEADPELSRVEQIEVWAVAAENDSELARDLLLDPLEVLKQSAVDDIGDGWDVTVERVNAQVPLPAIPCPKPPCPFPHHIIGIWTVIRANTHAHCMYYRVPFDPDDAAVSS
jgi:hypothetical protein